jgi:hypothetical protein
MRKQGETQNVGNEVIEIASIAGSDSIVVGELSRANTDLLKQE